MGSSCCSKEPKGSEISIKELMNQPKATRAVIVIQSVMESYLQSKRINQIKYEQPNYHGKEDQFADEYGEEDEIPELGYVNPTVEEIALRLGDFDYGVPEEDGIQRELRDRILFQNGAQYEGEWNLETGERDGRGVQVWADGS